MEDQHINNGGYDLEGVIWHQHSNQLMKKILEYFSKDIPVLDLGCGHNFYVSVLIYAGYKATGLDLVDLGSKHFRKADVTQNIIGEQNGRITNIISLEVGEHIPEYLSDNYIKNLTSCGGDIIMSWAIPGQEGIGHINCQTNEWVIDKMIKRGYRLDQQKTNSLREAVNNCHCNWFRKTLMYFTCE